MGRSLFRLRRLAVFLVLARLLFLHRCRRCRLLLRLGRLLRLRLGRSLYRLLGLWLRWLLWLDRLLSLRLGGRSLGAPEVFLACLADLLRGRGREGCRAGSWIDDGGTRADGEEAGHEDLKKDAGGEGATHVLQAGVDKCGDLGQPLPREELDFLGELGVKERRSVDKPR